MKIRFLLLSVVGLVLALCSQHRANASFTITPGEWVQITENSCVREGDGGEFQVNVFDAAGSVSGNTVTPGTKLGTFYTFCAATTLHFSPGQYYIVNGPSSSTPGTPTGLSNAIPFTTEASWLFDSYAKNVSTLLPTSFTGYVPGHAALAAYTAIDGMTTTDIAGAMQDIFWNSLEGTNLGTGVGGVVTKAESLFGWNANAVSVSDTVQKFDTISPLGPPISGVSDPSQPQLWVPALGNQNGTPEPASLIVWSVLGAGAAGFAMRRRKAGRWSAENRHAIVGMIETKVGH